MSARTIRFRLNGDEREVEAPGSERLLDTLRWRIGLRGTKEGCRVGDCGVCTILVDGRPTLSCLVPVAEIEGADLGTIEGLVGTAVGGAVARAFEAETGLQCGYCTPGFVVALTGLLKEPDRPRDPEAIWADLAGNLCRCTGYASIRRAVERAVREAP